MIRIYPLDSLALRMALDAMIDREQVVLIDGVYRLRKKRKKT